MSYTLTAVLCPLPNAPATTINPALLTPTVSPALVLGDSSAVLTKFNEVAARLDALGRSGGAYAVTNGLALSITGGLTLNVAPGQALLDQVVTVTTNQSLVLPDNTARVYVWLSQAGAISTVSNSLTAPGVAYVFLGSAVTSAGSITSFDMSGVMRLCGSTLCRFSADTACPSDAPSSNLSFLTIGTGGIWLWDGSAYHALQGGRAALTYASDADRTLSAAEYENRFIDFTASGTTLTATRKAILPLQAGRFWFVRNQSPGAQSVQFIGATGTGVTVANAVTVSRIICDGTNLLAG